VRCRRAWREPRSSDRGEALLNGPVRDGQLRVRLARRAQLVVVATERWRIEQGEIERMQQRLRADLGQSNGRLSTRDDFRPCERMRIADLSAAQFSAAIACQHTHHPSTLTDLVLTPLHQDHSAHVRLLFPSLLHICTNGARTAPVATSRFPRGRIASTDVIFRASI